MNLGDPMKKMLFLLNPCSGTRKANRYMTDIIDIFNRADYEVTAYVTASQGDCMRMAAERGVDKDLIVCCGGDGTFNELVAGLLQAELQTPIGYIPAGSTNDFAASMGLPTDILKAAKLCVTGKPVACDVGKFGGRPFSYVASFGIFTRSSYATSQSVKNALGHAAYVLGGIQELGQIKTTHVRLELADGSVLEDDYLFGAISNATSVGGILTLDPQQVDMHDGKLEVLLIRAPKDLGELTDCIVKLQRQEYSSAMVTFVSTPSVRVHTQEPMDWSLDGEKAQSGESVFIECLHNGIYVMKEEQV